MLSAPAPTTDKNTYRIAPIAAIIGLLYCAEDTNLSHLINPLDAELARFSIKHALHEYPTTSGLFMLNLLNKAPHPLENLLFKFGVSSRGYPELVAMTYLLIEQQIRTAIEKNNAKQIIMLNGGFSSVILRLSKEYPQVQFFDVDHGGTKEVKLNAFSDAQKHGSAAAKACCNYGANLHFIDSDIHDFQKVPDALIQQGFDKNKDSFTIALGVSIYLDSIGNHTFLETVKNKILSESSQMLICYLDCDRGITNINKLALSKSNEKNLGFYLLRDKVPEFIRQHNLTITGKLLSEDVLRLARHDNSIQKAENMDEMSYYVFAPLSATNKLVTNINEAQTIHVDISNKILSHGKLN